MRILKFGGVALRDGPAVRRVVGIVRSHGGERPLVVVSALGGVTAQLEAAVDRAAEGAFEWDPIRIRHRTLLRQLDLPGDLLDRHLRELHGILASLSHPGAIAGGPEGTRRRFRDFVLSFGERMSARIVAAALRAAGTEATPLDAHDLGLVTAGGRLGPPEDAPERVLASIRGVPGVPVVTGFLALDDHGHLTTLGRNGSDLTAAWLGAATGAEEVQLWKRVPGLLTADPALVPAARPLDRVGWQEAEEIARHGPGVLHPGSVEPAHRAGIPIHVRDLDHPDAPGTRIEGERVHRGLFAVAHRDVAALRIPLEQSAPEEVLARLGRRGLRPYATSVVGGELEVLLDEPRELGVDVVEAGGGRLETGLATVTLVRSGPRPTAVDEGVERVVTAAARVGAREVELGPSGPLAETEREDGGCRVFLLPRAGLPEVLGRFHAALS
jgi:aspartate kinase